MKTFISILLLSQSINANSFPHEVLLECTIKMQRLGFEKVAADESCAISAGGTCSEMQSQVVQKYYPDCVGDLIYLGVTPVYAMNFCNMAARRQKVCIPQNYIADREKFATCVVFDYGTDDISSVLNHCLEKVLLKKVN